jgi:hypothetical protein
MKPICFALSHTALCITLARADVALLVEAGTLRDAAGTSIGPGRLWAVVVAPPGEILPGGLEADSSLGDEDEVAIRAAFGGATIAPGESLGDAIIMATGVTEPGPQGVISELLSWTNADYQTIAPGGLIGIYWFPGIPGPTAGLPEADFEIGGFHVTDADGNSGGDVGMIVPPNGGQTLTLAYFDRDLTGASSSLPADRLTAVFVPQNGYQQWRDGTFTSGQIDLGQGAPGADPDGDRLSNLLEYATSSPPLVGGPGPLTLDRQGESVTLTFPQIEDPELAYRLESSTDLSSGTWTEVVFESSGTENRDRLLSIEIPREGSRKFYRLRVETGGN